MRNTDTFSVMKGSLDGYPMVAMILEDAQSCEAKGRTPWFLGFSTALSNPTPEGLPTPREAEALNRWEDVLDGEISSRCKSVFVGRVTWKGHRELLYYIDRPEKIGPRIQELIDSNSMRPFAFRYEEDREWGNVAVYSKKD